MPEVLGGGETQNHDVLTHSGGPFFNAIPHRFDRSSQVRLPSHDQDEHTILTPKAYGRHISHLLDRQGVIMPGGHWRAVSNGPLPSHGNAGSVDGVMQLLSPIPAHLNPIQIGTRKLAAQFSAHSLRLDLVEEKHNAIEGLVAPGLRR